MFLVRFLLFPSFPSPVPPSPSVFPAILCESLVIAVVGYCITLSMAKIFAARFGYRVDGNQEMFSEASFPRN